jgi:hypothetical protein
MKSATDAAGTMTAFKADMFLGAAFMSCILHSQKIDVAFAVKVSLPLHVVRSRRRAGGWPAAASGVTKALTASTWR